MEQKQDNKKIRQSKILRLKKKKARKNKKIKIGKKYLSKFSNKKNDKEISDKIFHDIEENIVVSYFNKFFLHKNHKLILPIASFFDTIIMIIPLDVMTIAYILKHNKTKILPFSIINSFATVLGSLTVYLFGYFYFNQIVDILTKISLFFGINPSSIDYENIIKQISQNQFFLTFTTSATSAAPFAVLAFFGGGLKFKFWSFLSAIFLGRFVKIIFITYLTKNYGISALKKISKNIIPFIILLFIGIFVKLFYFQ